MRIIITVIVMFAVVTAGAGYAFAQQKGPAEAAAGVLVDTVVKGCDKEIKTYCKDVTPGEGQVLACLYAYEDKLSGQCEFALYDAAVQLERVVTALAYLANECRNDFEKFCSNIKPGEGRLLQCIDKNDANVSKRCKLAMKNTGLK